MKYLITAILVALSAPAMAQEVDNFVCLNNEFADSPNRINIIDEWSEMMVMNVKKDTTTVYGLPQIFKVSEKQEFFGLIRWTATEQHFMVIDPVSGKGSYTTPNAKDVPFTCERVRSVKQ